MNKKYMIIVKYDGIEKFSIKSKKEWISLLNINSEQFDLLYNRSHFK